MIHAENGDMIEWLTDKLEGKGMVAPYYHALSRLPLVEGEATNRAIALAELVENPILFVHIGSVVSLGTWEIQLNLADGHGECSCGADSRATCLCRDMSAISQPNLGGFGMWVSYCSFSSLTCKSDANPQQRRLHSPTCFENSKMICSPPPPPDDHDQDALYL